MSSDKFIQHQAELSDTYDELIPSQQKRDAKEENARPTRDNDAKKSIERNKAALGKPKKEATDVGHGLVDLSDRAKRARSSG